MTTYAYTGIFAGLGQKQAQKQSNMGLPVAFAT